MPVPPYFTVMVRDFGREINKKDIEVQINILNKIKTNLVEVYENMKVVDLIIDVKTNELIIDKKNNSIIMMSEIKITGDDKGVYNIKYFKFYKTGLIIFNFNSYKNDLSKNISSFYTVINSVKVQPRFLNVLGEATDVNEGEVLSTERNDNSTCQEECNQMFQRNELKEGVSPERMHSSIMSTLNCNKCALL